MCVFRDNTMNMVCYLLAIGLQDRCGAVFAELANGSCVLELEDIKREQRERPPNDKKSTLPPLLSSKPKLARLHAAHALSMDVVLSIGLEMGSHAADCWPHVFRLKPKNIKEKQKNWEKLES